MFNFKEWIKTFQDYFRANGAIYNDAPHSFNTLMDVSIISPANSAWRVLGIHKLTPEENAGNHNLFLEVLCKQNEREGMRAVYFDWQGREPGQNAPGPIFMSQKGPNELVDIAIFAGMRVKVWIQNGDRAEWFHSEWPDEAPGNTFGHHSFFLCFQETAWFTDEPDPEPDPGPKRLVMTINKGWLDKQPVEEGMIKIYVGGES
jgi:hypothetical protein